MSDTDGAALAAVLLCSAHHAVALTGAGMSTVSGIPDFRSPGVGLCERSDPLVMASMRAFKQRPDSFYDWLRPLVDRVAVAEPNSGHFAVAQLERGGWMKR